MELQDLIADFEAFLTTTHDARIASERDRDYRDHKQWTDEELEKLKARNQAPVVINRTKTKVNLLGGIQRQRRTDPKALPRTPKHEADADSVTDAIRFVADKADFPHTSSSVFEDGMVTWGYGAAIIEVSKSFEIEINEIASDRFYFDPFSRRLDFKDARFLGIVIWMDEEEAAETFPEKKAEIATLLSSNTDSMGGTTFEDKPQWIDRKAKRFRLCQHYFKKGGVWQCAYFTQNLFLIDPKPCSYLNEQGEPDCPIEAQAAYIDRDNNRYGEVRAYIWPQDEINHRRSRALYLLSTRQVIADKGAVEDINVAKQELAKADGFIEVQGGPTRRFEIQNTNDVVVGQMELYQDAKGDIDSIGANAALSGTQEESLSGRAIQAIQQGGIAELAALFDGHAYWEKRVYRQVWARIKQYWTEERWIRVTDNEDNLRWVTLNKPMTYGQVLQEQAKQGNPRAQAALQQLIDDPRLNEVAEVRNQIAELDVDVVLTQSPDYATIRQEQFETMAKLAQSYGPQAVPFEVMLRLSDMTNKSEVMELLKPKEEEVDPAQKAAEKALVTKIAESKMRQVIADADKSEAAVEAERVRIRKEAADAEAQEIENEIVRTTGMQPQKVTGTVSTGA